MRGEEKDGFTEGEDWVKLEGEDKARGEAVIGRGGAERAVTRNGTGGTEEISWVCSCVVSCGCGERSSRVGSHKSVG